MRNIVVKISVIIISLIVFGTSCSSSRKLAKLSNKYAMMGIENKIELFAGKYKFKEPEKLEEPKEHDIAYINSENGEKEELIPWNYKDGIRLDAIVINETKYKLSHPKTIGNLDILFTIVVPERLISEKMTMKLHPRVYIRQDKKETVNFPIDDIILLGVDNNKGENTLITDSVELKASLYPGLDRVYIGVSGDIYEDTAHIYSFTMPERLEFSVVSTSNLADTTEKVYDIQLELRKANHGANYSIEFEKNNTILKEKLGDNAKVIADIKANLDDLMKNVDFYMDSIVISATSSPEGAIAVNTKFSEKRTIAISDYFKTYIDSRAKHFKQRADSLRKCLNEDISSLNEAFGEGIISKEDLDYLLDSLKKVLAKTELPTINFKITPIAENWDDLYSLIAEDSVMNKQEKELFYATYEKFNNLDDRENEMKKHSYYNYMRETLYPKLRVVKFNFHMHRKGMEHDTIWRLVPSEKYKEGVKALKEFEFEKAEQILKNYPSYNTAVCFIVRHKPYQALQILEDSKMQIDFEYYKAKRDSLTLLYISEDSTVATQKESIKEKILTVKEQMDKAAKIEFLKAKAYMMRGGEDNIAKALESYKFLLKMDKLNGLYSKAIDGNELMGGAIFGSNTYFQYSAHTDEFLSNLFKMKSCADEIKGYEEKLMVELWDLQKKLFTEKDKEEYNAIKEAYSMDYTNEAELEKALMLEFN
ncbi:MAG: hypothetical protein E7122_05035 [Bacteroidales bacterium]|nr:hypothetical protein [Bacteroidales bacterium]